MKTHPFLCLKRSVRVVFLIYVISDLVFSIGWMSLCCIRRVLTQGLGSLSWDEKQRHLVYMKKASTLISHSTAAWPDPWLQSLRHIFLPTGDCPFVWHGTEPAGLQMQHHSIQFVSDKSKNTQWVRYKHRCKIIVSHWTIQILRSSTIVWLHNWHIWCA